MTKKIFILFAISGALLPLSGQQRYIADKVVAVVGSLPVLYSEVARRAEQMEEAYRAENYTSSREPMAEALEGLLEQKLLYQRAQLDSIGLEYLAANIAMAVDAEVEAMIAEAGSQKALEEEKHKAIFAIREQLRGEYEEYEGARAMRRHIMEKVKVTPGEVEKFYRRLDPDSLPIIPEQYVYAQITKLPSSIELAKQRTRERLLGMRQQIIDGERFDRLATLYSVDPGSYMRGGEYTGPKEQWTEPFAETLGKLQPGQISSVVETEYGFHIIQLLDKLSANNYHFRHILLKPTYTDNELAETVEFLDSLSGVIRSGGITFEQAAKEHSDDKDSRMNGGVVSNQQMVYRMYQNSDPRATSTRFRKDDLEPNDATHLIRMKVGDISEAFIGSDMNLNEMGKMLRLVQIIPAHKANLSEDWLGVEAMALDRKQTQIYNEWLNKKIGEMYVRIDPMFSPDDFENKRWFK